MISAWWLIPAVFGGVVAGYAAASLAFTAKISDKNII